MGAQPQAQEAQGFLRLDGKESHKAYVRSVLAVLGVPMFGTRPVFCYDTVDYAAAKWQRPLGNFKP